MWIALYLAIAILLNFQMRSGWWNPIRTHLQERSRQNFALLQHGSWICWRPRKNLLGLWVKNSRVSMKILYFTFYILKFTEKWSILLQYGTTGKMFRLKRHRTCGDCLQGVRARIKRCWIMRWSRPSSTWNTKKLIPSSFSQSSCM